MKNNSVLQILFVCGLTLTMFVSCNSRYGSSDAFGNFEATEVLLSAEGSGRLLTFTVNEGSVLQLGEVLGVIDTAILVLQREQIKASLDVLAVNEKQIDKTAAVQQAKIDLLEKEFLRITAMFDEGAVTKQNYDQLEGEYIISRRQLEQILSQKHQIKSEKKVLEAQIDLLDEQINRCVIISPLSGTVLQKYAEAGEITASGKPLLKVADIDYMILRAYITGAQLSEVALGQKVQVLIDKGKNSFYSLDGEVVWVAASAEFTPKIIQTKEERVDLVYAIKIRVKNDGRLKIGMPGEVIFTNSSR